MAEHETPGAGTTPAPGPRRRPRPHQYTPDLSLPAVRGERPCGRCGLPRRNDVHTQPSDQHTDQQRIGDTT